MHFRFFSIPALDPQAAEEELNRFCGSHRVVSIERQWLAAGLDSHWAVCVTIASGAGTLPAELKAQRHSRSDGGERVDYKQILAPGVFAVFAGLRGWRKRAAEQEGVPVYAVFTNEQLAEIAKRRVSSLAELGAIDGIGPARLARHGAAVLEQVRSLSAEPPTP